MRVQSKHQNPILSCSTLTAQSDDGQLGVHEQAELLSLSSRLLQDQWPKIHPALASATGCPASLPGEEKGHGICNGSFDTLPKAFNQGYHGDLLSLRVIQARYPSILRRLTTKTMPSLHGWLAGAEEYLGKYPGFLTF